MQFTVQMSKLNGPGKTHRERIFVVELNVKLRSLFRYDTSRFNFLGTFCERLKLTADGFYAACQPT